MSLVRRSDGTMGMPEWPLEIGAGVEVTIAETGVAQKVSATSVPCAQALVQPKADAFGVASNAKMVLMGNSAVQLVQIRPDDFGAWLPTSNLDKLYVKGTAGDVVRITPAT